MRYKLQAIKEILFRLWESKLNKQGEMEGEGVMYEVGNTNVGQTTRKKLVSLRIQQQRGKIKLLGEL